MVRIMRRRRRPLCRSSARSSQAPGLEGIARPVAVALVRTSFPIHWGPPSTSLLGSILTAHLSAYLILTPFL